MAARARFLPGRDHASVMAASLVRAGEIAAGEGRVREALTFYGRAIDAYLATGRERRAEAVCRRVIALEPGVIRTRYTLAVLAVSRGDLAGARSRIADYMAAVARAHSEGMAVKSLLQLASATAHPGIRSAIAGGLRRAGRPELGDAVEAGQVAAPASSSRERALDAAMRRPADIDLDALTC